jgi:hypothetical protein
MEPGMPGEAPGCFSWGKIGIFRDFTDNCGCRGTGIPASSLPIRSACPLIVLAVFLEGDLEGLGNRKEIKNKIATGYHTTVQ